MGPEIATSIRDLKGEEELKMLRLPERSILSNVNHDDAAPSSLRRMAREGNFANFFVGDQRLMRLCQILLNQGKSFKVDFDRSLSRLLVHLSDNLRLEANDAHEKATVRFIRARSKHLAYRIRRRVSGAPGELDLSEYLKVTEHPSRKSRAQVTSQDNHVSEIEDNESEGNQPEAQDVDQLDSYGLAAAFVISGQAFNVLHEELQQLVNRTFKGRMLRWLCKEANVGIPDDTKMKLERVIMQLHRVSLENVWVSYEDKFSISNALKSQLEGMLRETWDWWPLVPCRQKLPPGYARLYWRCVGP